MILKFPYNKCKIFLVLFIFCFFLYYTNGEIFSKNDTKEEKCCDDQEYSISMRDYIGICAGIVVVAPPIIVLIVLLTYKRDSIKIGKTNKYSKLETVCDKIDNKYRNDKDNLKNLSNDAISMELSNF